MMIYDQASVRYGGGIANRGTLIVTGSTLSGNVAGIGGGIATFSTLTVTDSTFNTNGGGGIFNNSGTLTVTNSTLTANGTGIYNLHGTVTVTNSMLSGNSSSGIYNYLSSTLTVTNSTVSGNSATNGGGIFNEGTLTIMNSTISGNSATQFAGGVFDDGPSGTLLTNTIVAGNSDGQNLRDLYGSITSGGHNLLGDGGPIVKLPSDLAGTDTSPLNPLLGTLGSNGGPTQTFPLLTGSPAIGHGDPAVCNQTGTGKVNGVDQWGVTRPTSLCAIGAFEPFLSAIGPNAGVTAGGQTVYLTGAGFVNGATVTVGGVACGNVQVTNRTTLQCVTGAHAAGAVDVVVTQNSETWTLVGGYTYAALAPLPGAKPPGPVGGPPNALPGPRPSAAAGGPAPNPLPAPRP